MANEVVLKEYKDNGAMRNGSVVPVYSEENLLTTQVVDIGTRSAAFNPSTEYVTIESVGVGFWYIFGDATVNAAADTNGNSPFAANGTKDFKIDTLSHVDTAALT